MEPEGTFPQSQMPSTSQLRLHQSVSAGRRLTLCLFRNMIRFYCEELLALRPTPKLEDHRLSAYLFNIFAATLYIGGRSSFRSLRTRHAVMTGKHLSLGYLYVA
jgi:hypothetical protein